MSQRKKLKMIASNEATAVVADLARTEEANPRPDPEVRAVAKRRQFSAAYKLAVLAEADGASEPAAWFSSPAFRTIPRDARSRAPPHPRLARPRRSRAA